MMLKSKDFQTVQIFDFALGTIRRRYMSRRTGAVVTGDHLGGLYNEDTATGTVAQIYV